MKPKSKIDRSSRWGLVAIATVARIIQAVCAFWVMQAFGGAEDVMALSVIISIFMLAPSEPVSQEQDAVEFVALRMSETLYAVLLYFVFVWGVRWMT